MTYKVWYEEIHGDSNQRCPRFFNEIKWLAQIKEGYKRFDISCGCDEGKFLMWLHYSGHINIGIMPDNEGASSEFKIFVPI